MLGIKDNSSRRQLGLIGGIPNERMANFDTVQRIKIEERRAGGVTILAINGDLLLTGRGQTPIADRVRSELQQGHTRVVLDLARVRYVDSTGLGELVHAHCAVRNRSGAMRLMNVSKRVKDLLIVTRLDTLFDCFETEADTLASFAPG